MGLPHSPGRLEKITGFVPWRRAVERMLAAHDARLASPVRRVVLTAPNGTRHVLTVANDGTVSSTPE